MAKRVVTVETRSKAEDQEEKELESWLTGLGEGATKCKLYKQDEEGNFGWLATRPPAAITEEFIARYGPGIYNVRTIRTNGTWGPSRQVRIFADAASEELGVKNAAIVDPMAALQMSMMKFQMQMAQDQSNKFHELVLAMIGGKNNGAGLTEVIAAVTALKGATEKTNVLGDVKAMLEITNELRGDGGGAPDPMMSMLGLLPKILEAKNNNGAPAAGPATLPPAGGTAPLKVVPTVPTSEEQLMEEKIVFLRTMKEKAQLGKDPAFWADYIDENQDERACAWMLSCCRQYDWALVRSGLAQVDPQLVEPICVQWFERLYRLLRGEEERITEAHATAVDITG